jgi:hypothetical protein
MFRLSLRLVGLSSRCSARRRQLGQWSRRAPRSPTSTVGNTCRPLITTVRGIVRLTVEYQPRPTTARPARQNPRTARTWGDPPGQPNAVTQQQLTTAERGTGIQDALRDPSLRAVNIALGASICVVLAVIAGRHTEEPFAAASDAGDAILDLGIAYVAGWIFFYLVTWRPRAQDRWKAHVQAVRGAIVLSNQARSFLRHIQHSAGAPETAVSRAGLAALLPGLTLQTPTNIAAGIGAPQQPLAVGLRSALRQSARSTSQVARWSGVVDTELLRLTFDIVDTDFASIMEDAPAPLLTMPLSAFEPMLVEWLERSDALRDWTCENLRPEVAAADPTWQDVDALARDRCLRD